MVEAILPLSTIATRCFRAHSGIGLDVEHVKETIKLVSDLSQQERSKIAISCYETASLYFKSFQYSYPSKVMHFKKQCKSLHNLSLKSVKRWFSI